MPRTHELEQLGAPETAGHGPGFRWRVGIVLVAALLLASSFGSWGVGARAAPMPALAAATGTLASNDPVIGLWQRGSTILDVQASGTVYYIADSVSCRVGAVQGTGFTRVSAGSYTVGDGDFGTSRCTAANYNRKLTLVLANGKLSAAGSSASWSRPASTLAAGDPILGLWRSPDGTRVNEVRPDGSVRVIQGPACRLGQLDSYSLKRGTGGAYTALEGVLKPGACVSSSFTAGFKLTLAADGLRPQGSVLSWKRLDARPAVDKDSLVLLHYNVDGQWVTCGLFVFDKTPEVQALLKQLGLESTKLLSMDRAEAASLDATLLQKNAGNEFVETLYLPLHQAAVTAAQSPVNAVVPVAVQDDAQKAFKGTCLHRT